MREDCAEVHDLSLNMNDRKGGGRVWRPPCRRQAPKKVDGRMPISVANDRTTSSGTLFPVSDPDAST